MFDDNKIFEMLSNELNGTVPDEYVEDNEYDNISDWRKEDDWKWKSLNQE